MELFLYFSIYVCVCVCVYGSWSHLTTLAWGYTIMVAGRLVATNFTRHKWFRDTVGVGVRYGKLLICKWSRRQITKVSINFPNSLLLLNEKLHGTWIYLKKLHIKSDFFGIWVSRRNKTHKLKCFGQEFSFIIKISPTTKNNMVIKNSP